MTLTPPRSLVNISDQDLRNESDRGFTRIYQAHNQLRTQAILSPDVGSGFTVMDGETLVMGSKTGIASGLTNIRQVIAGVDNGAVATNITVTAAITPSDHSMIDLYCWQPTAAGDTTPIPATVPITVRWWVTGQ